MQFLWFSLPIEPQASALIRWRYPGFDLLIQENQRDFSQDTKGLRDYKQ
uniref:Uncharacterized protein n=1 Tax=Rhizophora mucronata TaxID=61149 RepID=A0A2P2NQC5_RHIMU